MKSRPRRRCISLGAAALVVTVATRTRADEGVTSVPEEKPRLELAAFPVISGNRDIGFQFGAAAFLTRVAYEQKPYFWRGETGLSMSVKSNPDGHTEIAQQVYGVRFDYPRAFDSPLRLMPAASYEHFVNAGYYGIGNASGAVPFADGSYGRRYQAILDEVQARTEVRIPIAGPVDALVGGQVRRTNAAAYPGSQLVADTSTVAPGGEPRVFGLRPMTAVIPNLGLVYDTRDNEISPRSGGFDILGVRAGLGVSESHTRYLGASIVLRHYVPLGPLVLAMRFMGDVIIGDAPFFDQIKGMTFTPVTMFGGARGVRGVPDGRYAGKIKMLATAELRALLTDFRFLQQRFRIGTQTFIDVGRVQSDFSPDPLLDGRTLGLKYGVGAGTYVIWGEGAIIRIEIAYSPDTRAYASAIPIGLYIVDSHSF